MPRTKKPKQIDQFSLFPPYSQAQIRHAILAANPYLAADLRRFPAAQAVVENAERLLSLKHRRIITADEMLQKHLGELSDWRSLFSARGKSHKILNRTLDAIGANDNVRLAPYLAHLELQAPLTDPVRLRFTLIACAALADSWAWSWSADNAWRPAAPVRALQEDQIIRAHAKLNLFRHAPPDEIEPAMKLYADFTQQIHEGFELAPQRSLDSAQGVYSFVRFLNDCPEAPRRSLLDYTWRTIDYHRGYLAEHPRQRRVRQALDMQLPLPAPVFTVPEGNIRQLTTVADLFAEAKLMQHCVDGYARKALEGRSFLFHVEHEGAHATVECDADGFLLQAAGPGNCRNTATDFARKAFGAVWKLR